MKLKLEIEGIQAAMKKMDKYGEEICKTLGPAVKRGADVVRDDAKSRINSISGELARGVISEVTWDKTKSKAFAGVGMDKGMNDKFVVHTKNGVRYYIPAAVEYGHRFPGGGGYVVMDIVKRGKRKGQFRAAANKKQNKSAKPHPFMRPAYKSGTNRAAVQRFVNDAVSSVINKGGD